nr:MAG TPA: hypothetical protein [Caudoviricetes sp.]
MYLSLICSREENISSLTCNQGGRGFIRAPISFCYISLFCLFSYISRVR